MRLVAGLEEPSADDILIDGQRVNDTPARDRDLAMVFQNYALYPHMMVGANIGYPLRIARVPRPEREQRVGEAAAKVEMGHLLGRRPGELSGGQRQRVALARAIVRRPKLFLMDEPLSNLDAKLRTVMRAELKHLQRELGTTTIYVTHDQVEAMTLADRIVILNDARIQQMGTPAEIYACPVNTFVAGFVGSPPMNLVPGRLEGGAFVHAAGRVPIAARGRLLVSDSHASGRPGPGIWAYDLATGAGALWYDRPLNFANGLAMRPGEEAVYVCETFARQVTRVPVAQDGRPGQGEIFAGDLPGLPDGIAFDAAGNLVIACYEPSRLLRAGPAGGAAEVLVEDVTAHTLCHPTNVAFDGETLYTANLGRWHVAAVAMDTGAPPVWEASR